MKPSFTLATLRRARKPVLLQKLAENKPLAEQIGLGKKPLEDFIVVSRIEGTITAK